MTPMVVYTNLSWLRISYEFSLAELYLIDTVLDFTVGTNPECCISLWNKLVHLLVIEIVIFDSLKWIFSHFWTNNYLIRNHSFKWAALDQEILRVNTRDNSINDLSFHGLEHKSLKADLVNDLSGGVLNSPIRNVIWLDPTRNFQFESLEPLLTWWCQLCSRTVRSMCQHLSPQSYFN